MIDQTKDKKDDVLASKLEADKKQHPGSVKGQAESQIERERAEIGKDQKSKAPQEQAGGNAAQAVQPIGSARITQDKAELRSAPGKAGAPLNKLSAQRQIDILGVEGDELKVLVDGKVGYIPAEMTDYAGAGKTAGKKVKEPTGSVRVGVSALRIRTAPGKDQNYIGTLRQADCVKIYGEKDGYLEVHIGDQVGYISAEHTDYDGVLTGKAIAPKEDRGFEEAPAELQDLLAKESLTAAEIGTARTLIAQCAENLRPELYETLQAKPKLETAAKDAAGGGDEFEALAASLEMIGVQNPQNDKAYSAYLAQLQRTHHLPQNGGMANWGSLVNAMGVNYSAMSMPGDRQTAEKSFWSEKAREQIRAGKAVMAEIDGQAVRIEAVEEDGLVVTLPDNSRISLDSYHGKAEQKSSGKRSLLAFDKLRDVNMNWVIALG